MKKKCIPCMISETLNWRSTLNSADISVLGRTLVNRIISFWCFYFSFRISNYDTVSFQISKLLFRDARTSESSSELRITTAPASRFKVSSSRNMATPANGLISENQTLRKNSDQSQARFDTHTALDTHMANHKTPLLLALTLSHQQDQPDQLAPSVAKLRAPFFSMVWKHSHF